MPDTTGTPAAGDMRPDRAAETAIATLLEEIRPGLRQLLQDHSMHESWWPGLSDWLDTLEADRPTALRPARLRQMLRLLLAIQHSRTSFRITKVHDDGEIDLARTDRGGAAVAASARGCIRQIASASPGGNALLLEDMRRESGQIATIRILIRQKFGLA